MNDWPYRAEYAKSGRAACKGCSLKIDKGELRLAIMVQVWMHAHTNLEYKFISMILYAYHIARWRFTQPW